MQLLNKNNINKTILIFLILQPIIDVMTSIIVNNGFQTITPGIFIRSTFMAFIVIIALISAYKEKKYRAYFYLLLGLISYIIVFLSFMAFNYGTSIALDEIKGIIKYFYLPLILTSFSVIFKKYKTEIDFKIFLLIAVSYILLIFVPEITNTGFNSYNNGKLGSVGWFYAANEVGAIIALLLPMVLGFILTKPKKKWKYNFLYFTIIYVSLFIGTKVPLLALIITLIAFVLLILFKYHYTKENVKKLLLNPLLLFAFMLLILAPSSPAIKNMGIQLKWLQNSDIDILDKTKEQKLNNLIYSSRNKYLVERQQQWESESTTSKIIGLGMNSNRGNQLVEMDYYDIFYGYGFLGFIIYFLPIVYLIINVFTYYFKLLKTKAFNLEYKTYGYGLVVGLSIPIAYFAGHLFSAPAVSIYFAIALVSLYIDIKTKVISND